MRSKSSPPARVLHHDAEVRGREEDLLEAHDVGVEQGPVVDELALDVAVDLDGSLVVVSVCGVWWGGGQKGAKSCEVGDFPPPFGRERERSKVPPAVVSSSSFLFPLLLLSSLLTLSPRSINFTATSSPVALSRISLATPKLPEPMSLICFFCFFVGEKKRVTGLSFVFFSCRPSPIDRGLRGFAKERGNGSLSLFASLSSPSSVYFHCSLFTPLEIVSSAS